MKGRALGTRTLSLSIGVIVIGLIAAPSASAATPVGATFSPEDGCAGGFTNLQTGSPGNQYAAPFAGVITSWSYHAPMPAFSPTPLLKLKVARPAGGDNFTIVGESALKVPAPSVLNTYTDVAISVQAGDIIGQRRTTGGACTRTPAPGYAIHGLAGDPAPGTTVAFAAPAGTGQLDISATLELDCDGDGFGDETQDPDTSSCTPDTAAPETTITKGPKDKTKKKRATFEFTSSEPGSSFQCTLDGKSSFKPCSSPFTVKVKKGKHSFQVQATDQAGNADASSATDDWKVKRKKKRK